MRLHDSSGRQEAKLLSAPCQSQRPRPAPEYIEGAIVFIEEAEGLQILDIHRQKAWKKL